MLDKITTNKKQLIKLFNHFNLELENRISVSKDSLDIYIDLSKRKDIDLFLKDFEQLPFKSDIKKIDIGFNYDLSYDSNKPIKLRKLVLKKINGVSFSYLL